MQNRNVDNLEGVNNAVVNFVIGLFLGSIISWVSMAFILNYMMDKYGGR